MNYLAVMLLLVLITFAACTPTTPSSCDVDGDCQAQFNRCSCSWVCLNDASSLPEQCPEQSCPGDLNPELMPEKPQCGCVASTTSGPSTEGSQVVRDCRII